MSACSPGMSSNGPDRPASGKTVGFVLVDYDLGIYQTADGKTDCPNGFIHKNLQQWQAQFPTLAARQAHLNRCGGNPQNRGPNCENVWFSPDLIDDPLPHREVQSRIAYGLNLDGTPDGGETATTCAHLKFISPDGTPGIDNQFYRFAGCDSGLRAFTAEQRAKGIVDYMHFRLLLEVSGVDDETNDDAVEVALYQGRDPLLVDSEGKASRAAGQSQRIEPGGLLARLRGKIVEGVLETEPVDRLEAIQFFILGHRFIRGMRLRLTLTPSGAEGLQTGYVDVEDYWQTYAAASSSSGTIVGASGPSAYAALRRLADGYKDPRTGACTGLSSARRLAFVRAHLIHPPGGVGDREVGR